MEKVETVKGKNEVKPKDCPRKDITITAVTVYTKSAPTQHGYTSRACTQRNASVP